MSTGRSIFYFCLQLAKTLFDGGEPLFKQATEARSVSAAEGASGGGWR
jgi:hypothetical protein